MHARQVCDGSQVATPPRIQAGPFGSSPWASAAQRRLLKPQFLQRGLQLKHFAQACAHAVARPLHPLGVKGPQTAESKRVLKCPFTAVTRVQIPSSTLSLFNSLEGKGLIFLYHCPLAVFSCDCQQIDKSPDGCRKSNRPRSPEAWLVFKPSLTGNFPRKYQQDCSLTRSIFACRLLGRQEYVGNRPTGC